MEYLVVKIVDGRPAEVIDVVASDAGPDTAITIAYRDAGCYGIVSLSDIRCFNLAPGPVEVVAVEDPAARLAKAAEPLAEK